MAQKDIAALVQEPLYQCYRTARTAYTSYDLPGPRPILVCFLVLNEQFHVRLANEADLLPLERKELVAAEECGEAESHSSCHHQLVKGRLWTRPEREETPDVGCEEGAFLILACQTGAARNFPHHLDEMMLRGGRKTSQGVMKVNGAGSSEHRSWGRC